jgi:hypothetical protein
MTNLDMEKLPAIVALPEYRIYPGELRAELRDADAACPFPVLSP